MYLIVLTLFSVCIVERNEIENVTTDYWFNVFTGERFRWVDYYLLMIVAVVFEITSAYGTVGLSLGSPVVCH